MTICKSEVLDADSKSKRKLEKPQRCVRESKITYYPEWYPLNNHLALYQRHPTPCVWSCVRSSCEMNSELCCVWSHLIGMLLTMQGFWLFLQKPDEDFLHPKREKFLFSLAFTCGCVSLAFSAMYHVLHAHSERYYKISLRLDFLGIILGIQGPLYTWIYYSLYCEITLKYVFMTIIALCGLTAALILTTSSVLLKAYTAKYRAIIAISVYLVTIPAFGIIFYRDGFLYAVTDGYQAWGFLAITIGGSGVMIYCTKIPESWYSGRYDNLIGSHAIFHVLAAFSLWVCIYLTMLMQEQRYMNGGECPI